ncbi:MAG: hypothetical protein LBT09_01370 [Planctomycetaceae bacterium]|jgi:hypothetical protein|nr:hypothetical protein [Planctomycetaceae bacterium]
MRNWIAPVERSSNGKNHQQEMILLLRLTLWDLGLYYLLTSSTYFSPKTHEKLINLTKELGVEIMSKNTTVKFYTEAKTEGRVEGIVIGETNGIAKSVIRRLQKRFSEPSERLKTSIMAIKNEDQLYELLDFAYTCVSLGEFETAFN